MVNFMKKICVIFLIIIFLLLTGCGEKEVFTSPSYPIIEEPTDYNKRTVDGYRDYNYEKDETPIIYYCNTNSKVFHLSDCKYAKKINERSIIFDRDRNSLISKGYSPCSYCNP